MCHSTDSRPPALPNPGVIARSGALELTSADGTVFSALEAIPAEPTGVRIVLLPDIRGTHPYYQALADRFAQAGFATAAIDYYGRTAGVGVRDDRFEWRRHLPSVRPDDVVADVEAAAAHLGEGPLFTVGFCFGGGQSWRLAASDLGVSGVIGFYGLPYERQVYEGAPHSFFDATYEEWQDACDDAWSRTLAFIGKHR
ncbi:dienelactone hydrolase family protein [Amycolatopsis sp. NBC_01307]|uniref:dienelactone hydrolase family protein n=1 Tax=Amycolatopsis sp. NBC_01307 TaxID=2903561 RepID=UPI002E0D97AB|nr:dienelactone hydrolase family protein [Amycolatopsis sp. NBC_01307]